MCATGTWGAHESFIHPIFVLKNGCDTGVLEKWRKKPTLGYSTIVKAHIQVHSEIMVEEAEAAHRAQLPKNPGS
jgi:hypothetical protein